MLSLETFGLIQPWVEHKIFLTWYEHTNHNAIETVCVVRLEQK